MDALTTCNACEAKPMDPESPGGYCTECEREARARSDHDGIQPGDRVRSFDFGEMLQGQRFGFDLEGERAAFVEGVVEGFEWHEGCERYRVRVDRDVFGGVERTGERSRVGTVVFPPRNETPTTLGGVTCGVEKLEG